METFENHGLDMTLRENFLRSAHSIKRVFKPPTLDDFMGDLPVFAWCGVGETSSKPLSFLEQLFMESNLKLAMMTPVASLQEMEDPISTTLPGNRLAGPKNGIPFYIDFFLQKWKFACRAKKYGCNAMGTVDQLRTHEMTECIYRKLFMCHNPSQKDETSGTLCEAIHNSYKGLVHHLEEHGIKYQHLVESTHTLEFKDFDYLTDQWVAVESRLMDYPHKRFCLLMICENKTHVRILLREITLDKNPFRLPLPFYKVTVAARESSKGQYSCSTSILPHSEKDVTDDDCGGFEINKNFLRRTGEYKDDGSILFNVTFNFQDDSVPPVSSASYSTGDCIVRIDDDVGSCSPALENVSSSITLASNEHLGQSDSGGWKVTNRKNSLDVHPDKLGKCETSQHDAAKKEESNPQGSQGTNLTSSHDGVHSYDMGNPNEAKTRLDINGVWNKVENKIFEEEFKTGGIKADKQENFYDNFKKIEDMWKYSPTGTVKDAKKVTSIAGIKSDAIPGASGLTDFNTFSNAGIPPPAIGRAKYDQQKKDILDSTITPYIQGRVNRKRIIENSNSSSQ
ncbi:unnamed protein product [Orchesella dallaii]|uniref:Uncharacterized protein n=1 Tax=Orchesella dallaii TaxID=48710 RepID=A0ABP1PSI5_9HEXA